MSAAAASDRLWRALADPTRRAVLDLLRAGPVTTGELAGRFAMTRFGVMKHLRVLEEAGLLLVRRRGRRRFNHLNPVPLQRLVRRWVEPFAATRADALLRLERVALEGDRASTTSSIPAMTQSASFAVLEYELEIQIQAPRERVWEAFTLELSLWWPADFLTHAGAHAMMLEARPGGRLFEDWGEGQGMVWANVTTVLKGEKLELSGELSPAFGGPARSFQTFTFTDIEGGGTRVRMSDTTYGKVGASLMQSLEEGWKQILDGGLRVHVER